MIDADVLHVLMRGVKVDLSNQENAVASALRIKHALGSSDIIVRAQFDEKHERQKNNIRAESSRKSS